MSKNTKPFRSLIRPKNGRRILIEWHQSDDGEEFMKIYTFNGLEVVEHEIVNVEPYIDAPDEPNIEDLIETAKHVVGSQIRMNMIDEKWLT